MIFGLKNVGATYHRAINLIFEDFLHVITIVYIDDIVINRLHVHSICVLLLIECVIMVYK